MKKCYEYDFFLCSSCKFSAQRYYYFCLFSFCFCYELYSQYERRKEVGKKKNESARYIKSKSLYKRRYLLYTKDYSKRENIHENLCRHNASTLSVSRALSAYRAIFTWFVVSSYDPREESRSLVRLHHGIRNGPIDDNRLVAVVTVCHCASIHSEIQIRRTFSFTFSYSTCSVQVLLLCIQKYFFFFPPFLLFHAR